MNLPPDAPFSESTRRSGWRTVRFGDVVRNMDEAVRDPLTLRPGTLVGLEHLDPESLRIKRWGTDADGTSFMRNSSRTRHLRQAPRVSTQARGGRV